MPGLPQKGGRHALTKEAYLNITLFALTCHTASQIVSSICCRPLTLAHNLSLASQSLNMAILLVVVLVSGHNLS